MKYTNCKKCGARIFFSKTTTGKLIPIDANPDPAGNIVFRTGEAIVTISPDPEIETVYISHFATCQFAKEFRKK